MSPKVGAVINLRAILKVTEKTPAQRVNVAVQAMRDQGIPLRFGGDAGVLPCPLGGGWCLDTKRGAGSVNIIGALVLAFQPPCVVGDTCLGAAARTLEDVSWAYFYGVADGWDRVQHSREWTTLFSVEDYLAGYEAGMEARFRATLLCRCGARRFRGAGDCTACDGDGKRTGKTHRGPR